MPARDDRRRAGGSEPRLTAAGRVLAVLATFGPHHEKLSLSDISRRSGLTLTTTHRLVGELREWGALERDDVGKYAIGLRLLELTALAPRGLRLRELAQPFLEDLHDATGANVHLAVRDGDEVIYIESLRTRGAVDVLSRIGGRWPVHATSTGQVLLAHASAEEQETVLAAPLAKFTEHTIIDSRRLREVLADVRRSGVAIAESQLTPGALAVAVPIRGESDGVIAAMGVTIGQETTRPHALVPVLTATSRAISRACGAPSAGRRATTSWNMSCPTPSDFALSS